MRWIRRLAQVFFPIVHCTRLTSHSTVYFSSQRTSISRSRSLSVHLCRRLGHAPPFARLTGRPQYFGFRPQPRGQRRHVFPVHIESQGVLRFIWLHYQSDTGSPAALFQSMCRTMNTPAVSLSAMLKSASTVYTIVTVFIFILLLVRLLATALVAYILFFIIIL